MPYALMYSSSAAFPLDEQEVDALLGESRERNAANGITGVLLYIRLDYENSAFLQLLEGSEHAVEETYRRIERDELHRELTVLTRDEVPTLRFGEWKMKFVEVGRDALRSTDRSGAAGDDSAVLLRDRRAMDELLTRFG